MAEIANIFVRISAQTEDFRKQMDNVQKRIRDVGDRVSKAGKTMTKWVSGPIAGAATALGGLAYGLAQTGDRIAKTASKLGVSIEAYQELEYWASQNGISQQAMQRAVGRLNQRIGLAIEGNEKYAKAFKNLNVELKDGQGNIRDTEDVLKDTISALMEIEDPALRSAKAAEIFGTKMARDLMPALEDGSLSIEEAAQKAHELGIIMDEETVRASEEFNDNLADMTNAIKGTFLPIASEMIKTFNDEIFPVIREKVIPAFQDFMARVMDLVHWFMELDPVWQRTIVGVIGLLMAIGPLLSVLGSVIKAFSMVTTVVKIAGVVIAFLTSPIGLAIAAIAALIAIGIWLWRNWDKIKEKAKELGQAVRDRIQEMRDRVRERIQQMVDGVRERIENMRQRAVETVGKLKDRAVEIFHEMWEGIKSFFTSILRGGIIGLINDYILKPFFDIDLFQIGRDIINGLWRGISSMGSTIKKNIEGFINRFVPGPVKKVLGIRSPSRLFAKFGENVGEGFSLGMEATKRMVEQASAKLAESSTVHVAEMQTQTNIEVSTSSAEQGQKRPANIFFMLDRKTMAKAFIEDINNLQGDLFVDHTVTRGVKNV